ncbi:MAG: hypothetical protein L0Y56_14545, partial [Nitrospira sp.]|nr:hypothetical protein [Nitrospira sp.]
MKAMIRTLGAVVFAVWVVTPFLHFQLSPHSSIKDQLAVPSLGNVQTLLTAYNRWKARITQNGADRKLVLPLNYSKGLSAEFTEARGRATLDFLDGSLAVMVTGLPGTTPHDVWLIDNRLGPGNSVRPDATDAMLHIGVLQHQGPVATLQT